PAGRDAVDRADKLLKDFWKGHLSRDLLAALPGNPGRLLDDLQLSLRDKPGHLSLYELTVENGTPLAESREHLDALPDEAASIQEWQSALSYLENRGYRRYEISNFALEGEESLHNLGYWRMQPYLGVGPGAVSTFPSPADHGSYNRIIRRHEPNDLHTWLSNPGGSFTEEILSPGELALEHYMMGLRTAEGLSISRFFDIFNICPGDAVPKAVKRWSDSGMLESDIVSLKPTYRGMELLDTILADIAMEAEKVNWSKYCKWPQP
ncbi:MAG: hypothetical protein KAH21_12930, partial [Spirochaetaceae bacterium]|nr:hypothetical protein [Spirochaetaceae bacterium]